MNRLLVVETRDAESQVKKELVRKPAWLVSSNEQVVMNLREAGLDARWLGEDASLQDFADAQRKAISFARNWYRELPSSEVLVYRGIQLGSLVELSFGSYLINFFQKRVGLQRFLEKYPIQEATLIYGPQPKVHSFYSGEGETSIPFLLREAGVWTEEVLIRSRRISYSMDLWMKTAIRSCMPAWTEPGVSLKDSVLFCAAPSQIESVLAQVKGKHRLIYLDETFQFGKRARLREGFGAGYLAFERWCQHQPPTATRTAFLGRFDQAWPTVKEKMSASRIPTQRLDWFATDKVRELTLWIDAFHGFFDRENIRAVVLDEDVIEFRRCLASVARSRGIPSLVLLHATTPSFCGGFDLAPLTADAIAVGGEGLASDCVSNGIAREKIVVTGVPRYDRLQTLDAGRAKRDIEKNLGVLLKRPLVVFAATYINPRLDPRGNWWDVERAYRDFFRTLVSFPEYSLLVKLYQRDTNPDWIRRIATEEGVGQAIFTEQVDLLHAFSAADLAVSFMSGAVTEAFLLRRPIIILDYLKRIPPLAPLSTASGQRPKFVVRNAEELKEAIRPFLEHRSESFSDTHEGDLIAEAWVGKRDGLASQRVARIISQMLDEPVRDKQPFPRAFAVS